MPSPIVVAEDKEDQNKKQPSDNIETEGTPAAVSKRKQSGGTHTCTKDEEQEKTRKQQRTTAVVIMQELKNIPADLQLQIYDFFLELRNHQRQCSIDTICTKINAAEENRLQEGECIKIDEIKVEEDKDLRDSLPAAIRNAYTLINLIATIMYVETVDVYLYKCSFSFDDGNGNETDMPQVFRLQGHNQSYSDYMTTQWCWWDALYDIHTFEYLGSIDGDAPLEGLHMGEVFKMCGEKEEHRRILKLSYEEKDETHLEKLEDFNQWLKEVYEPNGVDFNSYQPTDEYDYMKRISFFLDEVHDTNYAELFLDEFTKIRSLLHERCL